MSMPIQTKVTNKYNTNDSSKQIDGRVTKTGREKKEKNGEGSERWEGSIGSFYTVTLHGINVFLHVTQYQLKYSIAVSHEK